jgi:hypothetical protein
MAIAFDNGTNSGVQASVAAVTYAHSTGAGLTNGAIVVFAISRGGAILNTDPQVTAVTYHASALTKGIEVNSLDTAANTLVVSAWYGVAPFAGSNNVIVTFSGTVNSTVIYTATVSGVAQINSLDSSNKSNANGQASPDTTSITIVNANSWIFDGIYNKIGTALTKGTSQNLIAAETFPNGGGDTADASFKGPISAGSQSMSWTFSGSDDYAQAVIALKAASGVSTANFMPFFRP